VTGLIPEDEGEARAMVRSLLDQLDAVKEERRRVEKQISGMTKMLEAMRLLWPDLLVWDGCGDPAAPVAPAS
jgi:hypothetical protein